jgi:hypothetical protein
LCSGLTDALLVNFLDTVTAAYVCVLISLFSPKLCLFLLWTCAVRVYLDISSQDPGCIVGGLIRSLIFVFTKPVRATLSSPTLHYPHGWLHGWRGSFDLRLHVCCARWYMEAAWGFLTIGSLRGLVSSLADHAHAVMQGVLIAVFTWVRECVSWHASQLTALVFRCISFFSDAIAPAAHLFFFNDLVTPVARLISRCMVLVRASCFSACLGLIASCIVAFLAGWLLPTLVCAAKLGRAMLRQAKVLGWNVLPIMLFSMALSLWLVHRVWSMLWSMLYQFLSITGTSTTMVSSWLMHRMWSMLCITGKFVQLSPAWRMVCYRLKGMTQFVRRWIFVPLQALLVSVVVCGGATLWAVLIFNIASWFGLLLFFRGFAAHVETVVHGRLRISRKKARELRLYDPNAWLAPSDIQLREAARRHKRSCRKRHRQARYPRCYLRVSGVPVQIDYDPHERVGALLSRWGVGGSTLCDGNRRLDPAKTLRQNNIRADSILEFSAPLLGGTKYQKRGGHGAVSDEDSATG